MTDKELQKLSRRDLLQLLLEQAQEAERLRQELSEANGRMSEMEETFQRLRERLNDKDAQISEQEATYERLCERLNEKDAQIQELNQSLQTEREDRVSSQEAERLRQELSAANERLRQELSEANGRMGDMEKTFQRLRERLNDKDAQILEQKETYERLRERLDEKDARIQELSKSLQAEGEDCVSSSTEAGSIAEAALRLYGIFDTAQRAADLYLQKVRESNPLPEGVVMADVISDPAQPENVNPAASPVPPFSGRIVDIEPRAEEAAPSAAAAVPPSAPPPPTARWAKKTPAPEKESEKRGLFQKKPRERGKFVLSFGWEEK